MPTTKRARRVDVSNLRNSYYQQLPLVAAAFATHQQGAAAALLGGNPEIDFDRAADDALELVEALLEAIADGPVDD